MRDFEATLIERIEEQEREFTETVNDDEPEPLEEEDEELDDDSWEDDDDDEWDDEEEAEDEEALAGGGEAGPSPCVQGVRADDLRRREGAGVRATGTVSLWTRLGAAGAA